MARKQDTRTVKPAASKKPKAEAKGTVEKKTTAKVEATKPTVKKTPKAKLPEVRRAAPSNVRSAVSATTSAPSNAKKALKSARAQAKALIADIPAPHVPAPISEGVQAIGNQIVSWMSSDLGRAMIAELLVYVARQLQETAAKTEGTAQTATAGAGAKLGAAAADAGAAALKSGKDVSEAGAAAVSNTEQLVRTVAQAAMGVVGDVVAEVAGKAIARRSGSSKKKGRKPKGA